MDAAAWLPGATAGLLTALIPAVILAWNRRSERKARQPLDDARAQTETETRLSTENKRLAARNNELQDRLDEQDSKIDQLIAELRQVRADLEGARRRIAELENPTH